MIAQLPLPLARNSDPVTSREAAERVKPGNGELVRAIRFAVGVHAHDPAYPWTAFDIAEQVEVDYPGRWAESTIRTAVSRAGLTAVDVKGKSPRGQRCVRFTYPHPSRWRMRGWEA